MLVFGLETVIFSFACSEYTKKKRKKLEKDERNIEMMGFIVLLFVFCFLVSGKMSR